MAGDVGFRHDKILGTRTNDGNCLELEMSLKRICVVSNIKHLDPRMSQNVLRCLKMS